MGWGAWMVALLILIVLVYFVLWVKAEYFDAKYFEGYKSPSDLPLQAKTLSKKALHPGHLIEKITIQGSEGEVIPALFHYPAHSSTEPVPCVVMLYGIAQTMKCSKEFAHKLVANGFALICHEQLGRGSRDSKKDNYLAQKLFTLRKRCALAVIESRRIVDWLTTRPEVDASRVYLLGISLGSMLGAHALALEPRFAAGILMWGGADFSKITTESEIAKQLVKSWQRPFLRYGARWFKPVPADPMDCLHLLGGRPLLMQNPLHDEIIPKNSIDLFHSLVPDHPKNKVIKWYNCTHEIISAEVRRQIADDQTEWLKEISQASSPYGEE